MNTKVKFSNDSHQEFAKTLRQRVNAYFKDNNISKTGGGKVVVKMIFMASLYLVPFILMLLPFVDHVGYTFLLYSIMGLGMAGIGVSFMHDANHASLFKSPKLNVWAGRVLYLLGGNPLNWKIQHNVLHHTYTNVDGMDQDIDSVSLLRFSPGQKRKKIHRFQHIYAFFFYMLLTASWMTSKEYLQMKNFRDLGLLKGEKKSYGRLLFDLTLSKLFYFGIFLVLPLIFAPGAWWQILLAFLLSHAIASVALSLIFQSAHVMPNMEFPTIDEKNEIKGNLMAHQLLTTTNFAQKNPIISWSFGGLNYQVEHHLFPNICHVHYPKISKIVKETALEYGLPYHSKKTFIGAVWSHIMQLRYFGKYDLLPQ